MSWRITIKNALTKLSVRQNVYSCARFCVRWFVSLDRLFFRSTYWLIVCSFPRSPETRSFFVLIVRIKLMIRSFIHLFMWSLSDRPFFHYFASSFVPLFKKTKRPMECGETWGRGAYGVHNPCLFYTTKRQLPPAHYYKGSCERWGKPNRYINEINWKFRQQIILPLARWRLRLVIMPLLQQLTPINESKHRTNQQKNDKENRNQDSRQIAASRLWFSSCNKVEKHMSTNIV